MGHHIWWELQEDCYRYTVSDGEPCEVRIVISEFLVIFAEAWIDGYSEDDEEALLLK